MDRSSLGRRLREMGINARFVQRPFTATDTSIQLLPEDELRVYFFIQNNSSADMIVNYGAEVNRTTGVKTAQLIGAGGFFEPNMVPVNSVYIVSRTLTAAPGVVIFAIAEG